MFFFLFYRLGNVVLIPETADDRGTSSVKHTLTRIHRGSGAEIRKVSYAAERVAKLTIKTVKCI